MDAEGLILDAIRAETACIQRENYNLREMICEICVAAGVETRGCDHNQVLAQIKRALKNSRNTEIEQEQNLLKREIEKQDGELQKLKKFLNEFDELEQENKNLKLKVEELSQMNEMLSNQVKTMSEQMDSLYSFMDIDDNLDDVGMSPLQKSLTKVLEIEGECSASEIVRKVVELKTSMKDRETREKDLREQLKTAMELLENAEEAMNHAVLPNSRVDVACSPENEIVFTEKKVGTDLASSDEKDITKRLEKLVIENHERKNHLKRVFNSISEIFGTKLTRFSDLCEICQTAARSEKVVRSLCTTLSIDKSPDALRIAVEKMLRRQNHFFSSLAEICDCASYNEVIHVIKKMKRKIRKLRRSVPSDIKRELESMKMSLEHEHSLYSEFVDNQLKQLHSINSEIQRQKQIAENILNSLRIHILRGDFSRDSIANLLYNLERQASSSVDTLNGKSVWNFAVDLKTPEENLFRKRNSKYQMRVSSPSDGVSLRIREIPDPNVDFDPLFRQRTMIDYPMSHTFT